ncbi:vancomycin resistance protein YoaR [Prauserella shujinwangii]|uniref:Vancomycin resistance protein YoaR n=1 Tax=Prauserella shujinwangii TaxID=1453103 RepID=A0A2T0LZG4_9PSEU|nr:VanW family protein [Prauserella shujinwangii]PRX49503.1 vancomycin resistance protein YoaR [Prauserella shujinwangii]
MPQDRQWPESHNEQTDVLPAVQARPGQGYAHQGHAHNATEATQNFSADSLATQQFHPAHPGATERIAATPGPDGQEPAARNRFRKPAIIAGAVFGVLALVYGIDLLVTQGSVPRGVTVTGVEVGGMSQHDAEEKLRAEIEPRLTEPVRYVAGAVEDSFDPKAAGLGLDWSATLEQAGDQPLNPITRITSFFTTREVGVVTQAEPNQLDNAIAELRGTIDREPVEGNVTFEGATPVPVEPKQGQELDAEGAKAAIIGQWASGGPVTLPVRETPVQVTAEAVRTALEQIAKPAVSGPVIVHGEGKDGTLEPEEIAAGLSFKAEKDTLKPQLDRKKIIAGVQPELASTEQEGKDAEIVFEGGEPTVVPSQEGNVIKWDKTLKPLLDVLKKTEGRELDAVYEKKPAKVTTEEANKLGINEVISEFTTGGFAPDSGVNIRVVAEEVDGAIVKPGETFSLNGHTGPRGTAQGYVPAGIIENGQPGEAVGGGISQFATTLYNASYFAGMTDAGHREHSYYISRYPMGREATVFQNPDGSSVIDLKFTNNTPTGVAIQTIWTPSSITVRLWGTKHYEVESVTGERTNIVPPGTTEGPKENCHPSGGAEGFTVTDTRIIRDADSGEVVRREPRTVVYNPRDKVVCK